MEETVNSIVIKYFKLRLYTVLTLNIPYFILDKIYYIWTLESTSGDPQSSQILSHIGQN